MVVLGFVAGFTGWHCGTLQHESLGSVTMVQPGSSAGYVGHLSSQTTSFVTGSSHLQTLSQPSLNVSPCLSGTPLYTQKLVDGVWYGFGFGAGVLTPGIGAIVLTPGTGAGVITGCGEGVEQSGFWQHGFKGSLTSLQVTGRPGYLGQTSVHVYFPCSASSHVQSYWQPSLHVWPCVYTLLLYTHIFGAGVGACVGLTLGFGANVLIPGIGTRVD